MLRPADQGGVATEVCLFAPKKPYLGIPLRPCLVQDEWNLTHYSISKHGFVGARRKGTNGVSTNGVTANFMLFDRGTFWVLPLTDFYLPKSARAYLFPQSVKSHYFCRSPISVDPTRMQPSSAGHSAPSLRVSRPWDHADGRRRAGIPVSVTKRSWGEEDKSDRKIGFRSTKSGAG